MLIMAGHPPEQAKAETLARFTDPGPGHINCAQAVLHYGLLLRGLDPELIVDARYLGGGIAAMGEACGALTGAALALGLRDSALDHEDPNLRPRTTESLQELLRKFTAEFGSRRCVELTGYDLSTPEGHKAFGESEARKRCADYVGWMCDQLTPLLAGREAPPA
ncbi:MAG: hypothetical protein A2133_04740 [Actinobacteria bacterium RBG_16_64_13]|nr:MAG: hypothetical protein A2133_04740 [Actinobacteria bacterium RBG_16_64_13]